MRYFIRYMMAGIILLLSMSLSSCSVINGVTRLATGVTGAAVNTAVRVAPVALKAATAAALI